MPDSPTILTQQLFDRLFRQYERKLCAIAYTYVRDEPTARDIVHDSFMSIWNHREDVEFTNIDAYLFRTVRNRCLEYRRNRQTERSVYEKILVKERGVMDYYTRTIECCDPNELFRSEILEICRRQLEQMPELTRRIFTAHKFEGLSYKEIAERLAINPKKIDRELQHAASRLRLSLKDYLAVLVFVAGCLQR